jgi:curved DNA-binding protein CbpA
MIIKKPAICLASYNGLLNHGVSQTSSLSRSRRSYASVQEFPPSHREDEDFIDHWPQSIHPHTLPTPYQILSHTRGAPYTKTRFCELVKLYHPDHTDHPAHALLCRHISTPDRLERYRLIVAAHAILSNPAKRAAYDIHGAGWAGHPDVPRPQYPKHGPDSPMHNATWEDWEKWYTRFESDGRGRGQGQKPVFLSNSAFISLVAILAALGGIGQATRAETTTKSVLALRDEAHERASRELARVKSKRIGFTKEERIEAFLRTRDPSGYNHEGLRKVMLDMDVCGTGDGIRNRDSDFRRSYAKTGQARHPLQAQVATAEAP